MWRRRGTRARGVREIRSFIVYRRERGEFVRFEGCTGCASYIIPSDITRWNKKNGLFIMTPAIVKKGLSRILHEGCLIHQLHSSTSAASVSFISLKPNTVLVYVHDAKV